MHKPIDEILKEFSENDIHAMALYLANDEDQPIPVDNPFHKLQTRMVEEGLVRVAFISARAVLNHALKYYANNYIPTRT